MKIVCLGGGPAGVYLAISLMIKNPNHDITVYERNKPDDTFGWGVVFSDQTMENLLQNDSVSAQSMIDELVHWDYIDVYLRGQVERSGGHGFIGIGRKRMLQILYARARELNVKLEFENEFTVDDVHSRFADADLIVAADGLNSRFRNHYLKEFDCDIDIRPNKFVWLGTHQKFRDAFAFIFEQTEHGWIWAHVYQFDRDTSTFIVECSADTYDKWGFEQMTHEESAETCRRIFAACLGGHALLTNAGHIRGSAWINFPRVLCHQWIKDDRIVLIGDAAHTAHFSIGSGTKLGFEDAICLADNLHQGKSIKKALQDYQQERELEALKLQSAARNSMSWFEEIHRYLAYDIKQFTYSLLTRSQRVSHENLRLRDRSWLESVEKNFADHAAGAGSTESDHEENISQADHSAPPPMFTPLSLRSMELHNRIVVSPMSMYSAKNGIPDDWHFVHYGGLFQGGASLVITEMTNVSAQGRISPGCAGIWTDEQMLAWKRIVSFAHQHSRAKVCLQLGHSGPKGSTRVAWDGIDQPLEEGNWEILSPSAIPYCAINQVPRAMSHEDMEQVKAEYINAAIRAEQAGFDMLELHCAHGYLLSAFITPLLNCRDDEYGGSLSNRLRYPLEIFQAIRHAWPQHKPISVRISANDWVNDQGITPSDAVRIASAFKQVGADIIDVSAGQTSVEAKPVYGRMFQTPFADQIRNETNIATMAVGNIYEVDHVNSILASGRADLCCLARPHLLDKNWVLRAAAQQQYRGAGVICPRQYESGFDQLERNLKRAAEMVINV